MNLFKYDMTKINIKQIARKSDNSYTQKIPKIEIEILIFNSRYPQSVNKNEISSLHCKITDLFKCLLIITKY